MTTRIGFLGAGAMGGPMVLRLLQSGCVVNVWSRAPETRAHLSRAGARVSAVLGDAVRGAGIVIGCLHDTRVTRETYLGKDGVLSLASAGQTMVEHGTFDPSLATELADAFESVGCSFLDIPVSGGPEGARDGTLVAMAGGSESALSAARATIESYALQLQHVGPSGSGQRLKLINQLLVSVHVVAAAEATALAKRAGIDISVARTVLMGGWAASTMLDRVLSRAGNADFDDSGATIGKLAEVQPLISTMLEQSEMNSALLPPTRASFDAAIASGDADLDVAAMVKLFQAG